MATKALLSARSERSRSFFAEPSRYLRGNHRIRLRTEIVQALVGPIRGARILDLGCGNGDISAAFIGSANHITMVDSSAGMIAAARRHGTECIHTDALSFTPSEAYDLTLCIGVLAHVDSAEAVIAAIDRSLRPGGRCVLQLSDSDRPLNRLAEWIRGWRNALNPTRWKHHETALSDIVSIARAFGLRPIAQRDHLLLLPGMAKLMGRALIPYDRFVAKRPLLARQGMDTLILLERDW